MPECSCTKLADSFIETLLEDLQFIELDEGVGDERYDRELSTEAHEKIAGMCREFFIANEADILSDEIEYDGHWGHRLAERAGYNLYMEVVGHGVGYWDGRYPEKIGERLSDATKPYQYTVDPYVGDDGKVYI